MYLNPKNLQINKIVYYSIENKPILIFVKNFRCEAQTPASPRVFGYLLTETWHRSVTKCFFTSHRPHLQERLCPEQAGMTSNYDL